MRVGLSCAACHSSVDPASGKVLEGVTNHDLRSGLILAMSANPNAYFAHGGVERLDPFLRPGAPTVPTSDGNRAPLPDPDALADTLRATFLAWPPGNFDSTIDLQADPTCIPHCFTANNHPYGWSGFAAVGPFRGLSSLNNNVHALNSDATGHAAAAPALFGLDPETYLAIVLRGAPAGRLRWNPASGKRPSELLPPVSPPGSGARALNQVVALPTYPKATVLEPDGLALAEPGRRVWETVNAIAAFQNTISPPRPPEPAPAASTRALGEAVFARANCASCHAGTDGTNHRVIPAPEIGTEPTRAQAFTRLEAILVPPRIQSFSVTSPVTADAPAQDVPVPAPDQVSLAYALHGSPDGGYKVPNLVGLRWRAPYLHDGGVAVGRDAERAVGLPGTLGRGEMPDAANSLRALVDRQ